MTWLHALVLSLPLAAAVASAHDSCERAMVQSEGPSMLQVALGTKATHARSSQPDCVKQARASMAQCIPCKKTLADGTEVDRFRGNCKRDATVLASQIFTPWHFCGSQGECPQGRRPRWR